MAFEIPTSLLEQMAALLVQAETLGKEWARRMSDEAKRDQWVLGKQGEVNLWETLLIRHPDLAVSMAASMAQVANRLRQDIREIEAYSRKPDLSLRRKRDTTELEQS